MWSQIDVALTAFLVAVLPVLAAYLVARLKSATNGLHDHVSAVQTQIDATAGVVEKVQRTQEAIVEKVDQIPPSSHPPGAP